MLKKCHNYDKYKIYYYLNRPNVKSILFFRSNVIEGL